MIFAKVFVLAAVLSLFAYALTPIGLTALLKYLALGLAVSIVVALAYPELRGIRSGDSVSVVSKSPSIPFLIGNIGRAISAGRKNSEIRIRLNSGGEAVCVVEGYEGILSLPKVRIIYEEKLVE